MDSKINVTVTIKVSWWLRPVIYPMFIIMKLFRCGETKINNALKPVLRRGIKYKIGNQEWKRSYG